MSEWVAIPVGEEDKEDSSGSFQLYESAWGWPLPSALQFFLWMQMIWLDVDHLYIQVSHCCHLHHLYHIKRCAEDAGDAGQSIEKGTSSNPHQPEECALAPPPKLQLPYLMAQGPSIYVSENMIFFIRQGLGKVENWPAVCTVRRLCSWMVIHRPPKDILPLPGRWSLTYYLIVFDPQIIRFKTLLAFPLTKRQ